MTRKLIYLCDLTHTVQTISSEFFPYAVGCIATYLKTHSHYANEVEVRVFRFPDELSEAFAERRPDLIAFSNYVWNSNLANNVARVVKRQYPEIVTIFGGPDFSEDMGEQEAWMRERPWVDFYLRLEGERAFCNLVDVLFDHSWSVERAKRLELRSACFLRDDEFVSYETEERLKDINEIPSPYLAGILDHYFETSLWPIMETNRGCPFKCSFCTEGYNYFNKVNKRDNDKVIEELEYIAKHHKKQKMLFIADSNFLMFKENLDITKALGQTQKDYDWPHFVGCSTGKNRQDVIVEGASHLRSSSMTLAASVQSLDGEVLENVRRKNIAVDDLVGMALHSQETGQSTYTEVIACLPGDSLEKFVDTLKELVGSGITTIKTHTLLLIHGTELCTREARERFGFVTKFRAVTKSFGNYTFNRENFFSVEDEEVVVATSTLPYEDYLECRRLQLSVQLFYNDDLFREVHAFLELLDIPVWDWLYRIHGQLEDLNSGTRALSL